jgi:hypothetical protein
MRRLRWATTAAVSAVIACTGDDTPPSFFDSGTDATDAANDVDGQVTTTHAKLIAVHASPDVGAIRMCFATGFQNDGSDGVIIPIQPFPSTAISVGGGAVLPDLGMDLSQNAITPYVFLAQLIGTGGQTCDMLASMLTVNTDFYVLPTIQRKAFVPGTTVMLALTGCLRSSLDPTADATTCGAAYNASTGNLAFDTFSLDQVIANTQRFGAQVVHVASPASGVWSLLYGAPSVSASILPLDGGAPEVIDTVSVDQIAPMTAASLTMPVVDESAFQVNATNPDGGAPPVSLTVLMPLVYEATTGQTTGENTYFTPGVNYSFVFLGDPRQPTTLDGGAFNGYSLHALAFPNNPQLPSQ